MEPKKRTRRSKERKPRPTTTTGVADSRADLSPVTRFGLSGGSKDIETTDNDCFTGDDNSTVTVRLARSAVQPTNDIALWAAIRKSTAALSFNNYDAYINEVFSQFGRNLNSVSNEPFDDLGDLARRRALPFSNIDSYFLLKVATELFLAVNGAVDTRRDEGEFGSDEAAAASRTIDAPVSIADLECAWNAYRVPDNGQGRDLLPYMDIIRRRVDGCSLQRMIATAPVDNSADTSLAAMGLSGFLSDKLYRPYFFELIWSYWQEEGMLVQTMNAIARRFQNIRVPGSGRDPLANLEISGLFGLSNLLWGYIQDEQHRLSIIRRAYEYDHQYGISLRGKAIPPMATADSRSKFIEAFHHLLNLCSSFFKQDDDTTVRADGFPLLNSLREVHIILAHGAHNQFGDLPSTARQEMLQQQWILARPEFSQFLPTRLSVGYPENWMDRVDAMKALQGWNDTSVTHFNNLAVYGEQMLLSIRYDAWTLTSKLPASAANWARDWRAEIQGYIHSYRAVTGVDLSSTNDSHRIDGTSPSIHLANRSRLPGARI